MLAAQKVDSEGRFSCFRGYSLTLKDTSWSADAADFDLCSVSLINKTNLDLEGYFSIFMTAEYTNRARAETIFHRRHVTEGFPIILCCFDHLKKKNYAGFSVSSCSLALTVAH